VQAGPPSGAVSERASSAHVHGALGISGKGGREGSAGASAAHWCVCRPGVALLTRWSISRSQDLPNEAECTERIISVVARRLESLLREKRERPSALA